MNIKVKEIVILRIKYAIYNQYVIYLHMSPKEAINEIKRFDEWLKNGIKSCITDLKAKLWNLLKLTEKLTIVFLYQLQFCLRRLECLSSRFFLIRVIGKR